MESFHKKSGIYKISNLKSGKFYVGSAVNIGKRWNEHRRTLRGGIHKNKHLQAAWSKYGEGEFLFEVIELVNEKTRLIEREQYFIDTLLPVYNVAKIAGSQLGFKHSQESLKRMGIPHKRENLTPETIKKMADAQRGRKLSSEIRERMSKAQKGLKRTEETKKRMSAAFKGRVISEEMRKKISLAKVGTKRSPESIQKARESYAGYRHSQESKLKMSLAKKGWGLGRKLSDEVKRKMSEVRIGKKHSDEAKRNMRLARLRYLNNQKQLCLEQ